MNKFSEIFKPPILMTICGHSYCQKCLIAACPQKSGWLCPLCNQIHNLPATDLARNRFAEQIVESYSKNDVCNLHQEPIKLCKFVEIKIKLIKLHDDQIKHI